MLLEKVAETNGVKLPENCRLYEDVDVKTGFRPIMSNLLLVRYFLSTPQKVI